MFCQYCGKELKNRQAFCPYCGRKLEQSAKQGDRTQTATRETGEEQGKRSRRMLVCLLLLALLGLGAVGTLTSLELLGIPIVSDIMDTLRGDRTEEIPETEAPEDETDAQETTLPEQTEQTTEAETTAPPEPTQTEHVHSWVEATYAAPRTCSGCGLTEGLSLGTPLSRCTVAEDSQSSKGTDITVGTLTDETGTRYEDALMLWVNAGRGYVNTEYVVYRLAGAYDILQGLMTLAEQSDGNAAVRFYIYGDGKLLYKSGYLKGTEAEEIQIDVSGVQELKVECVTDEACQSYGLLAAQLFID